MNIENIYIGVDIAKNKFDVCLYKGDYLNSLYDSFSNDSQGFLKFLSFISSLYDLKSVKIGFEATSTYMVNFQMFLDSFDINYILINPAKLSHYIKYKRYESKTDKLDSFYIADYISTLKNTSFVTKYSSNKMLYKSYNAYLNMIIKTETHLKGLNDSVLSDDFTSEVLKKEIIALKLSLSKTKNAVMKELLESIKVSMPEYDLIKNDLVGVGDKTLLAVLPLIYDISQDYTLKQLQSYIGLNPVYKDSGSSVHKKQFISKSGNNEARKMLYMSAVASISSNFELREKYQKLVARGKPKKLALIAISAHIFRAIVTRLNHYKGLNL